MERLKRGDIWTVSGRNDYAGKPRPAVVLQDHRFDATGSVTICPLTIGQDYDGSENASRPPHRPAVG